MKIEEKIKQLGLILPQAPKPVGSYRPVIISGSMAFLSGQISRRADGSLITGKLGHQLKLSDGQEAARVAVLNVLGVIHQFIRFEKLSKIVRIVGYVQAASNFTEISQVMNGASDLLIEILGDQGVHARSAVGMASLPLDAAVEIEATIEIKP